MSIALTSTLLSGFLAWARMPMESDRDDLNVLCLQGASPLGGTPSTIGRNELELNTNEPDKQNDAIVLYVPSIPDGVTSGGRTRIASFVGTIEPGKYFTQTDPNPLGAAHLTFGQHLYTWGLHKNTYPCLRGLGEKNRIWRDKNGNFRPDVGEAVYELAAGTNLHAGSRTDYIGQYSAGCANIGGGVDGAPYKKFLCYKQPGAIVPLNVWRGVDLFYFQTPGYRPTLVLGMKNPWVVELQEKLSKKGFPTLTDGDWREKTSEVVVAFQKSRGLTPDGWVGPKTWAAL